MIELLITVAAFFGCAMGDDAEITFAPAVDSNRLQIIRAIDSVELQGLNKLEAYNADEWFV